MEQQTVPPIATQSEESYVPPKATFIALNMEEKTSAGPKKKSFLSMGCC